MVEAEGGEFFTRREATARNLDALQIINNNPGTKFDAVPRFEFGGLLTSVPKFNFGGQVPSAIAKNAQIEGATMELADLFKNQKAPIVRVKDIRSEVSKSVNVEQGASFG